MVLDYSDRRPVTKNRPRKQPIGLFIAILLGAVALSFVLGFAAGWLMRKPATPNGQPQQTSVAAPKGVPDAASAQTRQLNPESGAAKNAAPPLTFYETLPKGEKAIIGSGLNPVKSGDAPAMRSPAALPPHQSRTGTTQQPVPSPAVQQPQGGAGSEKAAERADMGKAPAVPSKKPFEGGAAAGTKPSEPAGKFCVQVMSSKERKEAEAIKSRLVEKGLPAYIIEYTIKDRGVWYRVRVGRHLTQQAADELSARVGKGAMVLPE